MKLWKKIRTIFRRRGKKARPLPTVRVEYGPRQVPSLREQIESWPKINRKEMFWGYGKDGQLIPVVPEKGRGIIKAKIHIERAAEHEHLLHTHLQKPLAERAINVAASTALLVGMDLRIQPSILPSKQDVIGYALAKNYAVKTLKTQKTVKDFTLSVINTRGKEIGRIRIEIPEESLIKIAEEYYDALPKKRKKMGGAFKKGELSVWARKYGMQTSFTAREGYVFDYEKEIFVKKKVKK